MNLTVNIRSFSALTVKGQKKTGGFWVSEESWAGQRVGEAKIFINTNRDSTDNV